MGNARSDTTDIRYITEDELPAWGLAVARGFLRPHVADGFEFRRLQFEPNRFQGAFDPFDPTRCVGTFRSFDTELTVPGGGTVRADAITGVTVTSTHRRRGLLSRMMTTDLADAHRRGCPVAILIAAEYNIYGRFGFGPATVNAGLRIAVKEAGGLRAELPESPGGRVDFVTMAELRELGPDLHERWRRTQPGAIARKPYWWRLATGEATLPGFEWKEPFAAVHRDASGTVTGLIVYRLDDKWDGPTPDCTLTVADFVALDTPTAVALWRLAFSVDWVRTVEITNLAPDDPLPLWLNDPRAAKPGPECSDFTWLRVLDVPAAFAARRYGAPGRTVLEVTDRYGWTEGRWALEVAPDGTGRCVRTEDPADLALGASQLGSLYLGAETLPRLVAGGLVTELLPGAAARADLLLRTPLRAWNPDGF
ncbi:GNAT family N-acetyltransferase [Kitasatospora sp. NPDC101801]|uniref:GNAT family N-acetyltransferase n=1 Tax=Kitasatospora sp. NPDC101801 TaxID=3364103 RepID=UPI00380843A7